MNGLTKLERARGFEPLTASLEGWNSTTELRPPIFQFRALSVRKRRPRSLILSIRSRYSALLHGGQARIRTLEADGNRFTVCPLCPLGYLPEHRKSFTFQPCGRKNKPSRTQFSCFLWPNRGLLFRIDNQPIPEAGNFTSDIDICQVGLGSFLCIFTASRTNWARAVS